MSELNKEITIPTMIPLREAARRTGLSYDFLRKACKRGEIKYVKCGNKFLVNLEKLVAYLNQE